MPNCAARYPSRRDATLACVPQGSVQARLDAFMAGKGASRKGAHATETGPASGFAWLAASDNVAFISDGVLSMAVQGTAQGLLDDSGEDGLTGAEVWRTPLVSSARSGDIRACNHNFFCSHPSLTWPPPLCTALRLVAAWLLLRPRRERY